VVVLLAAGCGGGRHLATGRTIFARSCSGCHTVTGHDTRAPGGDLAIARLSVGEIESFVRVMPVRLSRGEEAEVAAFVYAASDRR
jgi:mono/diheme cytochrome c family protein